MAINKQMKILVVEDSGFMQKLFLRNLNENGLTNVIVADNGADAIQKLTHDKEIELIISDWNMPDKDGLALLQWVRINEKYKSTPFIMATAQGDKTKELEAKDAGANSHIAKPFTAAQLLDSIEIALGMKEESQQTENVRRVVNGKVQMKVAHIQITDHLVLGVLKDRISNGEYNPTYFDLKTECMPGWNPVQKALEFGEIDAALVLGPIAMDLFAYNVPIKLVSLAHKNGSIMVRSANRKLIEKTTLKELYKDSVVNIPHKMSVHNMLAHKYLSDLGLNPGVPGQGEIDVRFEVVPPIEMPKTMMLNNEVAGFIVAEPIGSNAISKGIAVNEFLSKSVWKDHPCCVVAMRDDFIEKHEDAAYEFITMLVQSGKFIADDKPKSAEIAVDFLDPQKKLGLSVPVLQRVLEDPLGITTNDLYPVIDDFEQLQRYMFDKMGIGKIIDLEKFINYKFINEAVKE